MKRTEWLRLTWVEHRLTRKGFRRLQQDQAKELRARTRRHIHDVGDALFASQEVASELEAILRDMSEKGGGGDLSEPADPESP